MPPHRLAVGVRDYARHVDFPVASADSRGIQFAFLHKEIYSPAVLDAQHIHDLVAADYQRALNTLRCCSAHCYMFLPRGTVRYANARANDVVIGDIPQRSPQAGRRC